MMPVLLSLCLLVHACIGGVQACGVFTADDEEVVRRLLAVVGPMIRATQLNQQGGFLGNGMNNEDLKKDPQHTSILEQFPRRDDDSED